MPWCDEFRAMRAMILGVIVFGIVCKPSADALADAIKLTAIDGNTAVVGANGPQAAYVFVRNGNAWTQQAKLLPSGEGEAFGSAVSVHGDTILIGAPLADDAGNDAGKAYLFQRMGSNWTEQTPLFASDPGDAVNFGRSVSVNGNKALIGTFFDGVGRTGGAAYYFVYDGTSWMERKKLTGSPPAANDGFGDFVSLSGGTGLIGAPFNDDACSFSTRCNSGAAMYSLSVPHPK